MVDEALEHVPVVQQHQARLVVDLVPNDRRVVPVTGNDLAYEPRRVPTVGGVGEVHLLSGAKGQGPAVGGHGRYFGVLPGHPHRHGVRWRAEHDADLAFVGRVQDWRQPIEVEGAIFGLPGGPDGLAHPHDVEAGSSHEVEIDTQALLVGAP